MNRANTFSRATLLASGLFLAACAVFNALETPPQGWDGTRGPVIPHENFPSDCSLCHIGDGWNEIREDFVFDHGAETGTVLEGAHAQAECLRCHNDRGPVANYARRGCAGCHEDIHRGMLGKICADCHQENDWRPVAPIARHAQTRFPLVGAHASAACWRCHPGAQGGNFSRADTECVTCHRTDLARALNPDHQAMGWTSSCDRCHIPTSWSGAGFVHTAFPLTGMHVTLDCTECHTGGIFTGTPSDCSACHLPEFNATTDPDHQALMFSMQCDNCHTTSSWKGALFNHVGITMNCVTCHLDDYQATSNPNHVAAGFPTSCESCHTTNSWSGAFFNHPFPIEAGVHAGMDCTDCHTTPGNFSAFTCIDCHAHQAADMLKEHDRVPGYTYSSPACLMCHPSGSK